jgi:major membrane immunogen (membrane-anchored lipoprotein)
MCSVVQLGLLSWPPAEPIKKIHQLNGNNILLVLKTFIIIRAGTYKQMYEKFDQKKRSQVLCYAIVNGSNAGSYLPISR